MESNHPPQEAGMRIVDTILDRILAQPQPGVARRAAAAATTAAAPGQPNQAGLQAAEGEHELELLDRVDVARVLDELAARQPRKLEWRCSIADLMQLCGLKGSLEERRALAAELGYQGSKGATATMDIWLLKAVLKRLEQGGGHLPSELRS